MGNEESFSSRLCLPLSCQILALAAPLDDIRLNFSPTVPVSVQDSLRLGSIVRLPVLTKDGVDLGCLSAVHPTAVKLRLRQRYSACSSRKISRTKAMHFVINLHIST